MPGGEVQPCSFRLAGGTVRRTRRLSPAVAASGDALPACESRYRRLNSVVIGFGSPTSAGAVTSYQR
jgi:hypothetical protein